MLPEGLKRLDPQRVEVPVGFRDGMRVRGVIFVDESLEGGLEVKPVEQVANVATLPGIVGASMAMPDVHQGYGFAIGGVAAFDLKEGIVSPGGVGYDIN
jgi:tRNA-splicing ligase RtcB